MLDLPFSKSIPLGKTELQISPLGVGTWQWGDRFIWAFGRGYDEDDTRAAFDRSLAAGIDFFDSAEVYGLGRSERLLGQYVRATSSPVITATKFFPFPWRLHRKSLQIALRRSLKRMGMARVDLYQLHLPFPPVPIETWMLALAESVQAGLARAVGVSNYDTPQTIRAQRALAESGIPLASNQIRYSMLDRRPESNQLLETCQELGVTVIAYSPLAQGLLTGKYTPQNPPPGVRGRQFKGELLEKIRPLLALMREIGDGHGGKSPAQVALNWTLCKGTVPIPGAKNAQQAEVNAGALGWKLDSEDVKALDTASAAIGDVLRTV
ncbi:MAG: aldo/keto reductase [Anaerolineales bacterium]|jgi:aryl-alcohol dehydrogenase-like predicted oxidoreductase